MIRTPYGLAYQSTLVDAVKAKDLERAEIPYKDEKGHVADFHAASRHSHITQLIRSGASIVETKELARHADVRMTMRYTHISIDDQAKKLSRHCQHQLSQGNTTRYKN